ncbi:MAG: hypothetical protein AAGD06_00545 [Acidobacteriota bacterium]
MSRKRMILGLLIVALWIGPAAGAQEQGHGSVSGAFVSDALAGVWSWLEAVVAAGAEAMPAAEERGLEGASEGAGFQGTEITPDDDTSGGGLATIGTEPEPFG